MGVGGRGRRWGREGRTRRAARGETGNKGRSHVSSFRPVSPKTAWCSGLAWEGLRGCLSVPHVPCRPLVTEHLGGGAPRSRQGPPLPSPNPAFPEPPARPRAPWDSHQAAERHGDQMGLRLGLLRRLLRRLLGLLRRRLGLLRLGRLRRLRGLRPGRDAA